MSTFAELGTPFPLYEAPVETASEYRPNRTCVLCGETELPCFTAGIGDHEIRACHRCQNPIGLRVDETSGKQPSLCLCCDALYELAAPQAIHEGDALCWRCLRAGKAALSKDTSYGAVTWEQAVRGVTHGVPESVSRHWAGVEKVSLDDDWVGARLPSEHLWELLRTPTYSTWQGEQWKFLGAEPMIYLGEWKQADWNAAAENGDGKALFDATVDGVSDGVWNDLEGVSLYVYVFRSRDGSRMKAHWDID